MNNKYYTYIGALRVFNELLVAQTQTNMRFHMIITHPDMRSYERSTESIKLRETVQSLIKL